MRLTRTFIAATSITIVLLVALLAALLATQRSFGYHSWPTAREEAPRDQVVSVDAPVVKTPVGRAEAPDRERAHGAEDAPRLVATAPQRQASPRPRAAVEPAAPTVGPQPAPAQTEAAPDEPRPQPADEPTQPPVPSLPDIELPARDVPQLPEPNLPEPIEPELTEIGDAAPQPVRDGERSADPR